MTTIEDIRRENVRLLSTLNGGNAGLAARLGKSDSQISQWTTGARDSKTGRRRYPSTTSCRSIEEKLGLPPGWMDAQHADAGAHSPARSQPVRLDLSQDAPHVKWEKNMHKGSPVFWVALPDDAMAPRAPAGKLICFDTREQPRPGDGVLVVDEQGRHYFRIYRTGAAGRWTAHALNAAFEPMDSARDGLQVVAVLKAEEGRWA